MSKFFRSLMLANSGKDNSPLTFTAVSYESSVQLSKVGSPDQINLQYNKNNAGWASYNINQVIQLTNIGDKVQFKGTTTNFSKDFSNYYKFVINGKISASGDTDSLINYSSLKPYCYGYMFVGCTGLATAPQLPSTNLADYCYMRMFSGCTSLTAAPDLPATNLAIFCYYEMFRGCTSLNSIQVGFAKWNRVSSYSTAGFLSMCNNSGVFIKPIELIEVFNSDGIFTSNSYIPSNWSTINKGNPSTETFDVTCICTNNTAPFQLDGVTYNSNSTIRCYGGEKHIFHAKPYQGYTCEYIRTDVQTQSLSAYKISFYPQQNMTIQYQYNCFVYGTLITLYDGSTKKIQDITYQDYLLVWNFDEGKFDASKPVWIKKEEQNTWYIQNKFDNGTTLKITGQNAAGHKGHQMFIVEDQKFYYIPESVGKTTFSLNGNTKLIESKQIKQEVKFYNIITKKHYNLFANGILTSCSLNNGLYKIQNMKYIKEQKNNNYKFNQKLSKQFIEDLRLNQQIENKEQYALKLLNNMKLN